MCQLAGAAPGSESGRRDHDDEFLPSEAKKPGSRSPSQSAPDGVLAGNDAGNKTGCHVDVIHAPASQAGATPAEAALDVDRFTWSAGGLCATGLLSGVFDAAPTQDATATLEDELHTVLLEHAAKERHGAAEVEDSEAATNSRSRSRASSTSFGTRGLVGVVTLPCVMAERCRPSTLR